MAPVISRVVHYHWRLLNNPLSNQVIEFIINMAVRLNGIMFECVLPHLARYANSLICIQRSD